MSYHEQAPAPPQSTLIVINGQRTEKTLQMETDLAAREEKINRIQAATDKILERTASLEREQAEIIQNRAAARRKPKKPHWSDPIT